MKKKYSIIIPIYNAEKYLNKCLDSVVNQTYTNYEVIIVNDGSTDNSLSIIKEYTKDKRFKVYSKKNDGVSDARNYGLKYVTGDYICFLNSDDFLDKDLLLKLSEIKNKHDIIKYKINITDEDGKIIRKEKNNIKTGKTSIEELKELEFFEEPVAFAFRKDFFINNNFKYEKGKLYEDYGLTPLCYAKAKSIYILDYYAYNYVQRKGSIIHSTNGIKRMEDILYHYKKLIDILDNDKKISNQKKKTIKTALADRLFYNLKYVPINKLDEYIEKIKETNAIEYASEDKLKKMLLKKYPKIYCLLIKLKDKKNVIRNIDPQIPLTICLIFNVIYMLISSYLHTNMYVTRDTYVFGYYYLLFINFIIILIMIFKNKYKAVKVDLLLFLAILLGVIATLFAYNKEVSILGYGERREGLLHICYYISLVIFSSYVEKEKYKKSIINVILLTGLFQFIYGFIQYTNSYMFIPVFYRNLDIAIGTVGNPNFFGTYMLLCLSFLVGYFIDENRKPKQLIYYLLIIIFVIGVLISNALSCILAFILLLCALVVYLLFKKHYLKTVILLSSFLIPLFIYTKLDLTTALSDLFQTKDEIVEISKGNLDDDFGTDRMYLWKRTINVVPKHIWHGVGIDNFAYAFDGASLKSRYGENIFYDKAHNEYLQILVTQGIFALLCWLGIHLLIVNDGLIRVFKENKTYLLIPIVGYIIQSFFNISVIDVAPIFYIALGLCINRKKGKLLN